MSDVVSYHGWYSAEQYKESERSFRFLKSQLAGRKLIQLSFYWHEPEHQRSVRVTGPVEKVFRQNEVPFVQFPYLEHNPHPLAMIGALENVAMEHPELTTEEARLALTNALNFTFELHEILRSTGVIPEGIYINEQVQINLSHLAMMHISGISVSDQV